MFVPDDTPIIFKLPRDKEYADIYFIHDLHYGSELFNAKKWNDLKAQITADPNAYICWVGDLMEDAIPNSKSDIFTQTASPAQQKEWVAEQLSELKEKTIAVVPGNHCHNRATKTCGLYPLYDCCLIAGIGEKYRDTIAFLNIAIGEIKPSSAKQIHYFGQLQHQAKDIKSVHSADYTDGIDFFASGHDHEAKDRPRAKLVFDKYNNKITKKNIECINCGSFLSFGGYGAKSAYRPQSDKLYVLRISGKKKSMQTIGFYV